MHTTAIALLFLCGPPVQPREAEYLLRVESIGYKDAIVADGAAEPEERPLRMVETICRLNEPFHVRTVVGPVTDSVSGVLREAEDDVDGDLRIDLKCSHVVDTGESVPVSPGVRQKILDEMTVRSTIALREGVAFEAGGIITSSTDRPAGSPTPQTRETKLRVRITVEKYRSDSR